MDKDENTQALMDFDLSFLQATTYLSLLKLRESDVRTIAKTAHMARQDVYRIMPTLEKCGLAEKIVAKPTQYRATPIKKALSLLLEKKRQQYRGLTRKKDMLIKSYPITQIKEPIEETAQFIITSELSLLLRAHQKLFDETKTSIDIMVPSGRVPSKIEEEWSLLRRVMQAKKSLRIRLITNRPDREELYFVLWQPLLDNDAFKVKYVDEPINFGMHIFDNKQMTLQVSESSIMPSLWSNNSSVMRLATTYFDVAWRGQEKNHRRPKVDLEVTV